MEADLSDLDLLEIQVAVLFTHDERGRLVSVNESDNSERRAAPRFFWGRACAGSIPRFRYDLAESVVGQLSRIVEAEPVGADSSGEPRGLAAARDVLLAHAPIRRTFHGPAYRFLPDLAVPTGAMALDETNQGLLGPEFAWLRGRLAAYGPCFAVVVDGRAVSVCNSSRATSLAAEAGVETLEGFRGRGFAPRVVAAWAAAVREQGRIPLYSTWWENAASRAVARKLGLIQYGVDLHFS